MSRQYTPCHASDCQRKRSAIHSSITANNAIAAHAKAHGDRHRINAHGNASAIAAVIAHASAVISIPVPRESLFKLRVLFSPHVTKTRADNFSGLLDGLLADWINR